MNLTSVTVRSLALAAAVGVLPVAATLSGASAAAPSAATSSAPAAATSAAPYCGIRWGSLPKSSPTMATSPVTNVRAGRHACYDRLVIDVRGTVPGYSVRYVSTFTGQASGMPISLRGGAKLAVVVNAPAYTAAHTPTYTPRNRSEVVPVAGWTTFRQVRWDSSFEGYTSLGLGVRATLPFRVFTLTDGTTSRVVIDVAHRW
jgi:hypothetical protein